MCRMGDPGGTQEEKGEREEDVPSEPGSRKSFGSVTSSLYVLSGTVRTRLGHTGRVKGMHFRIGRGSCIWPSCAFCEVSTCAGPA